MKPKDSLTALAALPGIASLVLSLAGQGQLALITACLSLLCSVILFFFRFVYCIKSKKIGQSLLQFFLLIGLVTLSAGLAGLAYVSMSGLKDQAFDRNIQSMQRMSVSMSSFTSGIRNLFSRVLLFMAQYRLILLIAGSVILAVLLILQVLLSRSASKKADNTSRNTNSRPVPSIHEAVQPEQSQWSRTAQQVSSWQQWSQPEQPIPDAQQPSWIQPEAQAQWQVPQQASVATLPQWQAVQQSSSTIPITPDHCCICGAHLQDGCAALFESEDGTEALIDKACWSRINAACNGTDTREIREAINYLNRQLPLVDPSVADCIHNYLQAAEERLAQS